jgi:hypothetical protein
MFLRQLFFFAACSSLAWAQAPEPSVAEAVQPSVKKIDGTSYQIGDILFDSKSREIRLPAQISSVDRTLEFLIVHEKGKIYESLLVTKISPTHLNLALTLLRYQTSRELIALPNETGGTSGDFPDVPADVKAGARVNIEVEWTDDGKVRRVPASDWIQHAVKATAMPAGPWVYNGSDYHEGKYVPEMCGDIIGILVAPSAVLNYPGADNDNGNIWNPFQKRVPPVDTPVTVIITPFSSTPVPPKP